jgi:hypothetical protein
MRDLVFAELSTYQLGTLERHLAKTLYAKEDLPLHERQMLVSQLLRVMVELRIRDVEAASALVAEQLELPSS